MRRSNCRWADHRIEQSRLAAHPRLQRLATSGFSELNTWDLSVSHPSPVVLGPNPGNVTSLAYSEDGSLLAIASGEVLIRDSAMGKVQSRFTGPSPWIFALAFAPDGRRIASGDIAGNVILWDLATTSSVQRWATGSSVRSIVFLDPHTLVTHGRDTLLLVNVESGKVQRKVDLAGGILRFVADRAHGRLVVGFQNGAIGSVSLPDLTPGHRLENAHDGAVEFVALSPDGHLLATLGTDRGVGLRDALSFETLQPIPLGDGTPTGLTSDSMGRRLAIVSTGQDIAVWNLATLRDGLTKVGLAWDRPASAITPAASLVPEGEQLRTAVPVLCRPGPVEPAALKEARRPVQSGVGAFRSDRMTQAIRDLQTASDLLRILLKAKPNDSQLSSDLGISLGFLGAALRDSHRPVEATAAFREARSVLKAMRNPGAGSLQPGLRLRPAQRAPPACDGPAHRRRA